MMDNPASLKFSSPPIVEAVVDIDCGMPPTMELAALEGRGKELFGDQYPKFRAQRIQETDRKFNRMSPNMHGKTCLQKYSHPQSPV